MIFVRGMVISALVLKIMKPEITALFGYMLSSLALLVYSPLLCE
jgi:hypothetical protein